MGIVIVSWLLLTALSLGAGSVLVRVIGLASTQGVTTDSHDAGDASEMRFIGTHTRLWLGVALTVSLLQLWHLVWPIRGVALLLLIAPGVVGWWLDGRVIMRHLRARVTASPVTLFGVGLAGLVIANRAIGAPLNIDSGFYHFTSVRWLVEHPIVPGVGNIHDRLGFNNAGLLWNAMIEGSIWSGRSHHIVNGLFALWLVIHAAFSLTNFVTDGSSRGRGAAAVAPGLFLLPAAGVVFSSNVSSPATDPPATLASIAMLLTLIELGTPVLGGTRADRDARGLALAPCAIVLAALAVSLKISQIFLAASAAVGAGVVVWRAGGVGLGHTGRARILAVTVVLCTTHGAVWIWRSVLLSGYPAYPSSNLGARVDWAVPLSQANLCKAYVMADSRLSHDVTNIRLTDFSWFGAWARWQFRSINVGLTVLPACIAAGLALLVLPRWRSVLQESLVWVAVMLAIGLAGWFVMTPMPRFGVHLTWGAVALAGVAFVLAWHDRVTPTWRLLIAIGCIVTGLLPAAGAAIMARRTGDTSSRNALLVGSGNDQGFHPTPQVPHAVVRSIWGVPINIPMEGAQSWDGPLPCSPYPNRGLEWRRPGDIRGGFRVRESGPALASQESIAAAAALLARRSGPTDRIFLDDDAMARSEAFLGAGMPALSGLATESRQRNSDMYADDLAELIGTGNVWFVFADGDQGMSADEMPLCTYLLDWHGTRLQTYDFDGVTVVHYDMPPR